MILESAFDRIQHSGLHNVDKLVFKPLVIKITGLYPGELFRTLTQEMSTQQRTENRTADRDYVTFGRYAKILEEMSPDEFEAILSGELDVDGFLERNGLRGIGR